MTKVILKPKISYAIYSTVNGNEIRVFKGTWAKVIAYLGLAKAKAPGGIDIRKEKE